MVILSSLVHACGDRLTVLDVENSRSLEDEAVPVINQCRKLIELNIFGTSISDEGKARVIMGLPHLQYLVRADFLCDALGWIDYLEVCLHFTTLQDPKDSSFNALSGNGKSSVRYSRIHAINIILLP
jgi:hypothetical protein